MYKRWGKRFLDVVLASILFALLWPILLALWIWVKLDSPGSAIFKQQRLGLGGRVYHIYKFRSMRVGSEQKGSGVYSEKGDLRVTCAGRVLRATSLDELPQIVNVLRGDMSFIGPRPPLTYHPWPFEEYADEQKRMFEVRPGITGWTQVNGRKQVEWRRRIEMNVWYVDHLTFALDLKIFFLTFYKVLRNSDNENVGATLTTDARKDAAGIANDDE